MSFLTIICWLLRAMVLGAACYSLIALYAAFRFQRSTPSDSHSFTPPVTLIKPLYGSDRELQRNLESFCRQNYPSYEILFSVREESDEAVPIVRRLQKDFPSLPIRLLFTGRPLYLNAKVHAMEEMLKVAAHEILVISDSDVQVGAEYLRSVVAPLSDQKVGLVTCLARGVPGTTIWSLLESLSMNTQFFAGVITAWLLVGMEFALGPTMAVRKQQLREIGGFAQLGDYLADDFVLGELIAKAGYRVVISKDIPNHLFSGESGGDSLRHRLRWERSSRCSRPAGYVGQVFMHSLPLALLLWSSAPAGDLYALSLIGICIAARAALAGVVGWKILRDSSLRRHWWLVPVADLLSFTIWCWAFIGNEIVWRGTRFRVLRGGKLMPVRVD